MKTRKIMAHASADAWWGTGFKDHDWVAEHGGTIIYYKIKGEENSKDYKLRLYRGDKLIETEKNGSGVFDDAINGTYTVVVFEGTKKKASTTVVAHPGETIKLKFNLDNGKAEKTSEFVPRGELKLTSDSAKYVSQADLYSGYAKVAQPKPVIKSVPVTVVPESAVDPVIEPVVEQVPVEETVLGVAISAEVEPAVEAVNEEDVAQEKRSFVGDIISALLGKIGL
ncbi:MAG: hypothetical protein UW95_C0025G0008 [Parcubacteria group bacterium GW2011_GWC1_45_14]|nr:MAG: hypothetical protein UW95_C0025G0008 [Parcubacteria group bacterium GW2011_GWC1_45_14]